MLAIKKYTLSSATVGYLPRDAQILSFQEQDEQLYVSALIRTENYDDFVYRYFYVFEAGEYLSLDVSKFIYITAIQCASGIVKYIFEDTNGLELPKYVRTY